VDADLIKQVQKVCEDISGSCLAVHNPERPPCDNENGMMIRLAWACYEAGVNDASEKA